MATPTNKIVVINKRKTRLLSLSSLIFLVLVFVVMNFYLDRKTSSFYWENYRKIINADIDTEIRSINHTSRGVSLELLNKDKFKFSIHRTSSCMLSRCGKTGDRILKKEKSEFLYLIKDSKDTIEYKIRKPVYSEY